MPIYINRETWDYNSRIGWCADVESADGQSLIRHAVECSRDEVVTAPTYSESEKVYVDTLDQVPISPDYDDEDGEGELPPIGRDDQGFYYLTPRRLITPGVYKRRDKVEMEAQAKSQLAKWLEMMRRAGEEITKWDGQWRERE